MDQATICSVCLIETSSLAKICETDLSNIKLSCKLSSCVPEVEWNDEHLICEPCVKQLEVAFTFRNLCLQSTVVVRKKQWENFLKDEDGTIISSPEHNYDDEDMKDNNESDTSNKEAAAVVATTAAQIHQCKYCGIKFNNRKLLTSHNKTVHKSDRPYDCVYCDKSFKTCSDLTHHEKIHLNERNYECNLCSTSYNTTSILRKHKIIKHTDSNEWKYSCPHCEMKYPFKSNMEAHILRHHTNASDEYICFHCNKSYTSKILLISHIRTKHGINNNKKFTKRCNLCQNVYINQVVLEDHMRKEHSIGNTKLNKRIKQYQCVKCCKMYTTEKVMKSHQVSCDGIKRHSNKTDQIVKTEEDEKPDVKFEPSEVVAMEIKQKQEIIEESQAVKDEEEKYRQENASCPSPTVEKSPVVVVPKRGRKKLDQLSNTCQICGMVFNTRYLAKRHIRNVHATEKNYQCDVCDQKFASPVYLNAHKRYHSGERPHICSFCGKGFITGSDLYHHEKIHANKRAYKCDKCPKAFNTSSDLHKHKLCVHQDRNEWKYVCTFCDRRFPLKTNLDAHTKTHTGERNFACHLCDRRCVNRSVLLRHIKSHSNVRLFKCNICNMEYKYQKSLDIHMTKAHGIGDAKIPERVKKYFCHICPKSYFANNKLQKHIRTHTGERPFSCQMCEKRFIDKSYVKQHLKTAHNVYFSDTDLV